MTDRVRVGVEGRLGVLGLNRPDAINALSPDMIEAIAGRLRAWADDPDIRAVLFESVGERGFCSGGDVRHVRDLVLAGNLGGADAYFAAEYQMNGLIATYPKPVVAIAEGIVMGGGLGIAGHAAFRITTADTLYAMPEGAIGFFADVGANWILGKAPEARALLFLLSGLPVKGADVLGLGLADCCVLPGALPELRAGVVAAARTGDIGPALVALLQSLSIQAGERWLCALADRLADVPAAGSAVDILAGLADVATQDPAAAGLWDALRTNSPTSLEAILLAHRAARRLPSVHAVLALDRRLAAWMVRRPDFAEGVRARLVDKDRAPRWTPRSLDEVERDAIASCLDAPDAH